MKRLNVLIALVAFLLPVAAPAQDDGFPEEWEDAFAENQDAPLEEEVVHPSWFRLSFLDLREDLNEAVRFGKEGLVVYFGQKLCPYCKALMEENFGKPDIAEYTRRHFDVVAINIHGSRTVTDMEGERLSEKDFADREGTNLTPSLIFYDEQGREALRLRGYYPPYKFRAALEYVADGHYRNESYRDYLNRADPPLAFELGGLNEEPFFASPPYALDRSRIPAQRPLMVFFEQGDCHACDVLHTSPLQQEAIRESLQHFDAVQLNMWADTPVLTPGGERTTARDWADELGLFYAPTIIFFDRDGSEIMRVDSVVYFYRLQRILNYVLSEAWRDGTSMQQWLRSQGGAMGGSGRLRRGSAP